MAEETMNEASSARRRFRWDHAAAVLLYCLAFALTRAWSPELRRDEVHFWPTSLLFSGGPVPSLEQLADYGELNTPLAFLVFGWTDWLTGAGVVGARVVNCMVSLAALLTILGLRSGPSRIRLLAAIGLVAFPYFLGTSVHAYTDIIATALALWGVVSYTGGRHGVAALAFILGVSTRQYIVAFPAACLIHTTLVPHRRTRAATVAYLLATLSLLPWLVLFGGWAPASALARQMPATASLWYVRPQHTLYFLSCIGAYYVTVEWALFGPRRLGATLASIDKRAVSLLLVATAVAFVAFPPLGNVRYGIEEMGYLDRAARAVLPTGARMALFGALAAAAGWRFRRVSLASILLLANAGLMTKAHIGWDKYALPLLAVLWYLRAANSVTETQLQPFGEREPPRA